VVSHCFPPREGELIELAIFDANADQKDTCMAKQANMALVRFLTGASGTPVELATAFLSEIHGFPDN
jgi:hypothetical protein